MKNKINIKAFLRKAAGLVLILITVMLQIYLMPVEAYSLSYPDENPHIRSSHIIYFTPYYDFTTATRQAMNDSAYQWNKETLSHVGYSIMQISQQSHYDTWGFPSYDYIDKVYKYDYYPADNKNGVGYARIFLAGGGAGIRHYVDDGDIVFNTRHRFANGASFGFDAWSAFLHESGHITGLSHSVSTEAAMYHGLQVGQLKRTLSQDDKNGMNFIY